MKVSVLATITVVLALLAGVLWWQKQSTFTSIADHPLVGDSLLPAEIAKAAASITLESNENSETVRIEKHADGHWHLPDYYGLPADFSKLSSMIQSLVDASVQRAVTSNPDRLAAMNLGDKRLSIAQANGSQWQIELGENHERGGTFFKFADEAMAFLSEETLRLDTEVSNWAQKQIFNFTDDDITAVSLPLLDTGESIQFTRPDAESDFTSDALAEGETIDQVAIGRIIRSFASARYTEPVDPVEQDAIDARANEQTIELTLKDGQRYTIHIGRRPETEEIIEPQPAEEPETEVAADTEDPDAEPVPEGPAKPETRTIPAGPVFIRATSTDDTFPYTQLEETVALKYSDYIYNQLPKTRDVLIEGAKGTADEG